MGSLHRLRFIGRFVAKITGFVAPLTPLCLIPPGADLEGEAITPFTDAAACQGRLLAWMAADFDGPRSGDLKVTEQEFATFGGKMARRAAHKLARRLHDEHRDLAGPERCLSVALRAGAAVAEYGLTTVKQVTVVARAMLLFGDDFVVRDPKASRILTNRTLLPWQKKNQLIEWFVTTSRNQPRASIVKG